MYAVHLGHPVMIRNQRKNYQRGSFKDNKRKADLAKRIFKEFLISGKKGLDRIVREEIYKVLESEDENETEVKEGRS